MGRVNQAITASEGRQGERREEAYERDCSNGFRPDG